MKIRPSLEPLWALLTAALLALALLVMPALKYGALHTSFYDLGHYSSLTYGVAARHAWGPLFWGHAHPLLLAYAALYRLYPSPGLLVSLQSATLLASGGLLWVLWRRFDLKGPAHFLLLFLLSVSVWYNALFSFHLEHLLFLFYALFYWNLLSGESTRAKLAAVALALLICMTKEVYALTAFMLGFVVILRKRWYITGLTICGLSLLYFAIAVFYLIPRFTEGVSVTTIWAGAFSYLGGSFSAIAAHLARHPYVLLTECFADWRKLLYIGLLFGTFLFLPLLSWPDVLPALPPLALSILSHNPNHYAIANQYSAGVVAPLLIATLLAIHKLEQASRRADREGFLSGYLPHFLRLSRRSVYGTLGATVVLVHVLISPSPLSRLFFTNKVWSYGYQAYLPTARDTRIKQILHEVIPSDPLVSVSTQNTLNSRVLSHRDHCMAFPTGVTTPGYFPDPARSGQGVTVWADYVVLDVKRPWYLEDQGCEWREGAPLNLTPQEVQRLGLARAPGPLPWASCVTDTFRTQFVDTVEHTLDRYDKIFEYDGFLILKKR